MFYVILPNIRSLFNIGSIFRTADACGIDKIFLTGYSGRPDKQTKIAKTALGAQNSVAWEYVFQTKRVIDRLKKQGFEILALEQTKKSIDYRKYKPAKNIALIVGNEVTGISKNILKNCDKFIEIPMIGQKESLNVSVAFGIIVYSIIFNKHK